MTLRPKQATRLVRRTPAVLVVACAALLFLAPSSVAASRTYPAGDTPFSIAKGDFNRDGVKDLAVPNNGPFDPENRGSDDTVSILIGNPDGTFKRRQNYGVGNGPTSIAVGDFNEDRKQDLAVTNAFSGNLVILLGRGDGGFDRSADKYRIEGGDTLPYRVDTADFDADGHRDLVVGNFNSGNVSVLFGRGNGRFGQVRKVATGAEFTPGVAVGDFNRDGRADVGVAATDLDFGTGRVVILLGAPGRQFVRQPTEYDTGSDDGNDIAVGDFNRDGRQDLTTANQVSTEKDETKTVSVFLGTGTGAFGPRRNYAVGNGPEGVDVGDLNNDGKQDLVVSNNDFTKTPATPEQDPDNQPRVDPDFVSVLFGRGDGTFGSQVKIRTGDGPIAAVISDFNRDGLNDFAVALEGDNAVQVFLTARAGGGGGLIVGTSGNDVIDCGAGDSVVFGGAGNDIIRCGGGDDYIDGGAGNDIIRGGAGDDYIDGGAGNDIIRGGAGDDRIFGRAGNDILYGDAGSDRLFGNGGRDTLKMRDGVRSNDSGDGGPDSDICEGDPGDKQTGCP